MAQLLESRSRKPALLAGFYAVCMVLLAISGAIRNFTPIPIWDEWDAVVAFIMQDTDGNRGIWLAQHNEHRLLLNRLFVWLDWRLFGDKTKFLLGINLLIVSTIAIIFWQFIEKARARNDGSLNAAMALWAYLVGALVFWSQSENLAWGFQVHFFLLQLLPLAAFFRAATWVESGQHRHFVLALVLAILAAGALSTGLIALPVLAVYIWVMSRDRVRTLVTALIAVVVPLVYFQDYQRVEWSSGFVTQFLQNPIEIAKYVILYFGSPFPFVAGGIFIVHVATLGGLFFFAGVGITLWTFIKSPNRNAFDGGLVAVLMFIMVAAVATASGRITLGASQAITPRYTTSAIIAWIALCIAMYSMFHRQFLASIETIFVGAVIFGTLILRQQVHALDPVDSYRAPQETAVLAIELGIRDEAALASMYPNPAEVFKIGTQARDRAIFVFDDYPVSQLRESIGSVSTATPIPECQGALQSVTPIPGVSDYVKISGWLADKATSVVPKRIQVVDAKGDLVGYALTGYRSPEAISALGDNNTLAGFVGYVKSQAATAGSRHTLIGDKPECSLDQIVPE